MYLSKVTNLNIKKVKKKEQKYLTTHFFKCESIL